MIKKIRRLEDVADVATLVVIGALGIAMVISLATASGSLG